MIQVRDLVKSYGETRALRGISFDVEPGEIVGLLGPNGAGKTTTIKILTGYLQPDEGTVFIDGLDVLTQRREIQARLGYLPENAPLYPELSVQSYLSMIGTLRGIPDEELLPRISEAVYATGLQDHLTRPIGQLSKGFRQRVGLAQAILHKPRLLILDEPSLGLDPTQIVEIRNLIRRLSEQSTILFSTHILSEVEALCDRVIILMNGKIRTDARLSELASSPHAILVLEGSPPDAEGKLSALPNVQSVERLPSEEGFAVFRIRGKVKDATAMCRSIFELAREVDWPVLELRREVRTLETVFNDLATHAEVAA